MEEMDEFVKRTADQVAQTHVFIHQARSRLAKDLRLLQSLGIDAEGLKAEVADRIRFEQTESQWPADETLTSGVKRRKLLRALV